MKATLKFSFGNVVMDSLLIDGDYQFNGDECIYNHHFRFEISASYNGEITCFRYATSHTDWEKRKVNLGKSDYKNALNCALSDSYAAQGSFENFCSEFGYSTDSIKALAMYKECKRVAERLNKLFSGLNLLSIQNELEEMM